MLLRVVFAVTPILIRARQVRRGPVRQLARLPRERVQRHHPRSAQDAMYVVGVVEILAGRDRVRRAAIRRPARRRVAREDHRQPAAGGWVRRHRPARFRPLIGASGVEPVATAAPGSRARGARSAPASGEELDDDERHRRSHRERPNVITPLVAVRSHAMGSRERDDMYCELSSHGCSAEEARIGRGTRSQRS